MYRQGSGAPGTRFLRMGPVDDHSLAGSVLRPQTEQFVEHRVGWLKSLEGEGAKLFKGMPGVTPQDGEVRR